MTDNAQKPLPKSLSLYFDRPLEPGTRRKLSTALADNTARIVYGICDAAQLIPHIAVVMKGRAVVGWVLSSGWENDSIETVDALCGERMESLTLALRDDESRNAYAQVYLPLFSTRKDYVRNTENERFTTDPVRHDVTYHGDTCSDLTEKLGLVHVVELYGSALHHSKILKSRGVLIPKMTASTWSENHGNEWELVDPVIAQMKARHEQKPGAFWTLPKYTLRWFPTEGGPALHYETIETRTFLRSNQPETLANEPSLPGVLRIWQTVTLPEGHRLAKEAQNLAVEFELKRHYSDMGWTATIATMAGRTLAFRSYDNLIDGREAMAFAIETVRSLNLPQTYTPTVPPADAVAAFTALAESRHRDLITLGFVLDAEPPRPAPAD